jgi:alanine-glyoxylate transaminase/serine-glyoxylate transaminase/serine-pyruvate transaminase
MKKLFIVGPVDVFDDVLDAMGSQVIAHYGDDFVRLYHETLNMLRPIIGASGDVFVMAGPGTAGLDACMGSLLETGQRVLIPVSGFFSERLVAVARGSGLEPVVEEFEWGGPVDPDRVRGRLALEKDVAAVAFVHHETSTGVLNPLAEIADTAHDFGLPVIVDAVASAGGVPIDVDGLGIEFLVTVANKALEVPPGVAIVSVNKRGWELLDRGGPRHHGWYLDLRTWRDYATRWASWHPYPVTLPTSVVQALHTALTRIHREGLDNHFARFVTASETVRAGLREMGFTMMIEGEYACPVVSAVRARPEFRVGEMSAYLEKERGLMIAGGIGPLHGKLFRVGHMGKASTPEYIQELLSAVKDFLRLKGLA